MKKIYITTILLALGIQFNITFPAATIATENTDKNEPTIRAQNQKYFQLGDSLIAAVNNNNIELVGELLSQGADVNFYDRSINKINPKTPLMFAVINNNKKMVEFLVDHGANIEAEDRAMSTPLFFAIRINADTDIAQLLIKRGANIDKQGNANMTPLMFAILGYKKNMVKLLLDADVRLDVLSLWADDKNLQETALQMAQNRTKHISDPAKLEIHLEIIQLIENELIKRHEQILKRQYEVTILTGKYLYPVLANIVSKYETHDYQDIIALKKVNILDSLLQLGQARSGDSLSSSISKTTWESSSSSNLRSGPLLTTETSSSAHVTDPTDDSESPIKSPATKKIRL